MRKYVLETIDSIIAQNYPSFEIILIDDGSTDDTRIVLKEYIETNKIYYFYQPNGGSAKARNTGIKKSTSDLLMFVDADDILMPDAISELVSSLLSLGPEYCLVYGEREKFEDSTGKSLGFTNLSGIFKRGKKFIPNEQTLS
jgi:glycosyltransferase involved in cell wall biosynthesis